jgi:hypothetical protein
MPKSATKIAEELLEGEEDGLEELRIHEFADDEAAHDDAATEKLYTEFSAEFDRAEAELTRSYGEPVRCFPICGLGSRRSVAICRRRS